MTKIYESPDGGNTVYARKIGEIDRAVIKANTELLAQMEEDKLWGDIRRMGKTNSTMKHELERVIMLYNLIKRNE